MTDTKFKCNVCGREYDYNWWAVKKYKEPNGEVVDFIRCPKDGSPARVLKEETEDSSTIGKAIIGKATIK